MELALKKETVAYCGCVFEKSVKQNLDLGWNLPDYCADIQRILCCTVMPCVSGVSVGGGRASAVGEIRVRLIYLNDKGRIDTFFETAELSAAAELSAGAQDAQMLALAAVDYANPRAASARRFTLSGAVSVLFRAFRRETRTLLCGVENGGGQTKCAEVPCLSLLSCVEKTFDLSETLELPEQVRPMEKLLRVSGTLRKDSLKAVCGKLLLRGELAVELVYLSGGDTQELQRYEHRMPISQIIEVPDLTEEALCEVNLRLQCLRVSPRADSTGALRLADIQSQISAFVKAFEKRTQTVVTDCYATQLPLLASYGEVPFCNYLQTVDQTLQLRAVLEPGDAAPTQAEDVSAQVCGCSVLSSPEGFAAAGEMTVRLLCRTKDGGYVHLERSVEVRQALSLGQTGQEITGTLQCVPQEAEAQVRADGKLELTLNCRLQGELYTAQTQTVCVDAAEDPSGESGRRSALTLYFARQDEPLWDIAKHYRTSVAALREENALEGDKVPEERILFVTA